MVVEDYDATAGQKRAIAKLCMALGIREELEQKPMTRKSANALQYRLLCELRTVIRSKK